HCPSTEGMGFRPMPPFDLGAWLNSVNVLKWLGPGRIRNAMRCSGRQAARPRFQSAGSDRLPHRSAFDVPDDCLPTVVGMHMLDRNVLLTSIMQAALDDQAFLEYSGLWPSDRRGAAVRKCNEYILHIFFDVFGRC